MSASLMGAAFYLPDISTSDLAALLALADHANDSGRTRLPRETRDWRSKRR